MPRRSEIIKDQREGIYKVHQSLRSYKTIPKQYGVHHSTVQKGGTKGNFPSMFLTKCELSVKKVQTPQARVRIKPKAIFDPNMAAHIGGKGMILS